MQNYYWRLLKHIPDTFRSSLETWQFWLAIALVIFTYFVPEASEWKPPNWVPWTGITLLVLYVVIVANYAVAKELIEERKNISEHVRMKILLAQQSMGVALRFRIKSGWDPALRDEMRAWLKDVVEYLHDAAPDYSTRMFIHIPGLKPNYEGDPVRSQSLNEMDEWLVQLQAYHFRPEILTRLLSPATLSLLGSISQWIKECCKDPYILGLSVSQHSVSNKV